MKPLYVEDISITNFKNYTTARFSLGSRFNLAYGLNGTGKTNLLDSIYYLCVGRSYFTPFDQKVVTSGESFFRLEGKVRKDETEHQILVKVKPGITKDLLLDGVARDRISDHLGFLPVVISAPRDIDLIIGPGASRRKYIDHLLCQLDPEYLRSLVTYNHLLNLRTSALKQDFKDLRRMVQTYDDQMAPHASVIFNRRKWLRNEIAPLLQSNYGILSNNREGVNLEYESRLHEHPYEKLVEMSWIADKKTQRSNAGIHKDDFILSIKDLQAKDYASQGQIKSLIFALHLSKYKILSEECGYKPILILDDIFDKLDEIRLSRLMELLMKDDFGQVFLSDTSYKRVGDFVPEIHLKSLQIA